MNQPSPQNASRTHSHDGSFGALIRAWRTERGQSQLSLATNAGISTRHLSYLETGRSQPSREMVLALTRTLDVPLRDRNELLKAAGYAALFRETPIDAPALLAVREALRVLLDGTEPNPTFVVNRRYDILDANSAGKWLLSTFTHDPSQFELPYNMARLIASPMGMRPYLTNWDAVARKVFGRLRRDLSGAHARDALDVALLNEIEPAAAVFVDPPGALPQHLMVGVSLRRETMALEFFTTITTLGTPLDVTLQELRIETLFPANPAAKEVLAMRDLKSYSP